MLRSEIRRCQFNEWCILWVYLDTRNRTRERFVDEFSNDVRLDSPRDRFGLHIYLSVVETCLEQLKSRFEPLRRIVDVFSFLFPQQLMELSEPFWKFKSRSSLPCTILITLPMHIHTIIESLVEIGCFWHRVFTVSTTCSRPSSKMLVWICQIYWIYLAK